MPRKANRLKRATTKAVQAVQDKPYVPVDVEVKPENDDHEDTDVDGLNMRRRSFVEHITSDCFGNATRAAERAGYASENRKALEITACRLLGNARVQEAIRNRLASARLGADWTRHAIADYARSSMADFVTVDGGEPTLDWSKAAANGAIGHIREFKEEGFKGPDGTVDIVKRTFKIRDPMPALAILARMHGLVDGDGSEPERVIRRRSMSVGRHDAGNADDN